METPTLTRDVVADELLRAYSRRRITTLAAAVDFAELIRNTARAVDAPEEATRIAIVRAMAEASITALLLLPCASEEAAALRRYIDALLEAVK